VIPLESAFQSAVAPWLRDFVFEKRAVGYRCATEQYLLRRLDRHLIEHGHGEPTLRGSPRRLAHEEQRDHRGSQKRHAPHLSYRNRCDRWRLQFPGSPQRSRGKSAEITSGLDRLA